MILIEIVLLIVAYTVIALTLFLEVVCYRRNLETLETIAFTASLLILIIAFTLAAVFPSADNSAINLFTLNAMILVALTTPMNILAERRQNFGDGVVKVLVVISISLVALTIAGFFFACLPVVQYVIVIFLGVSIVSSMILIRVTRLKNREHRDATERLFAIAFMTLVPLSLLAGYVLDDDQNLGIGLTLPIVFILLAGYKLVDDLKRLGLLKPTLEPNVRHFENYLLSDREREIATLLVQGMSYKQIAERLFISMPTVKTHISHIYKKCGISSRSEFIALIIN